MRSEKESAVYFSSPLVRCIRVCSSGKTVSERSLAVELLLKALA